MTSLRFVNGSIVLADSVVDAVTLHIGADGRVAAVDTTAASNSNSNGNSGNSIDLQGGWLAPGFIDTQVNGGGGVLFNNDISVEGLRQIARAHCAYGTTAVLPTLISEGPEQIAAALDALDAAMAAGVRGVIGVHIEGPVLNAARRGIHDASKLRALDAPLLELLMRPQAGIVMVTLAPERVSTEAIRLLVGAGVRVSIGHSEASYEQICAAFDAGATGITHLFNAMPPMHQRFPGVVGAALDDPRPWCGLIVDRVHVAPAVLRVALRARPLQRMMLVTDAMSSVGAIAKDFLLQGRPIQVRNGICLFEDGTLAGSDLDMARAVANCVADLGLAPEDALRMASTHPAAFLGLSHQRGAIRVGLQADLAQLDADFAAVATWIGGERRWSREPA